MINSILLAAIWLAALAQIADAKARPVLFWLSAALGVFAIVLFFEPMIPRGPS